MTTQEILAQVVAGTLTPEVASALIEANNKTETEPTLSCKMGETGVVSVYGLMRFPVSLYPKAWKRLAKFITVVLKFIEANEKELERRGAISKAAKKAAKAAA